MWDPYKEFESTTLPNGLTVYAVHEPKCPWESMGFLIHTGAEHDPINLEGLAHFIEHLVPQNTIVPQMEMVGFFAQCGGSFGFNRTGYPATCYYFSVPTSKKILAKSLAMFGHMLFLAKFERPTEIERERAIILNEFDQRLSDQLSLDLIVRERKALDTGYWLERMVWPLGTPRSINQITQSDLQKHYDAHYTPKNMSIVGVGGMTLSELVGLLSEGSFMTDKKGTRTSLPAPIVNAAPPVENRVVVKGSSRAVRYRSVAKIPGNINEAVIQIMSKMLNQILQDQMRLRYATYQTISSYFNFRYFYEFFIKCPAFPPQMFNQIEKIINTCIISVGKRIELLKSCKHSILARYSLMDLSGQDICDQAITDLENYQRIIPLKERGQNIQRVQMDDIQSLILQWLNPRQKWTLIVR